IWRTWCDPCRNEFPDIMKLEQEFKDRGLAVVTYCGNADDEKTIEEAKQIIGEYSFSANLAASDEFNKALPWNATPITYFVDREGKVVASPFLGANIRKCREIAESLVSGTAPEAPSVTDISEDAGKEKTYSVHVNDQNGDAVKGAVVSFCTDTDCNIAETDEAGIASFTGPSYPYHIQIIQVPDEYRYDSEFAAAMDDDESTMTVTIEKK
ncbi:MAG: redoxin domain-containing protein, partial [Solobacterium sp.]|nr:redoxin domain-containing protein [Solobacterium sp.]